MNHDYKYSFDFDIKDFDTKYAEETVQSSIVCCDGCEWQLQVDVGDPLKVYLRCLATKRPSGRVPTSSKISLMKQTRSLGPAITMNLIYGKDFKPHNLGYGSRNLISQKNLTNTTCGYYNNNCITIRAEINTFRAEFGDSVSDEITWNSFAGFETDAIFIVDGQCIAVHRLVLAKKCQFFRTLLYPISDNEITLNGCDFKATKTAIRFIYTDECIVDPDNLQEVLKVGKKFGLKELLLSCFELLTPENAALFVSYLDDLQPEGTFLDHQLKEYFWNFVQKNLQTVMTSETFWSLSDDEMTCFVDQPEVKSKISPAEQYAILRSVKNRNLSTASSSSNLFLCIVCQEKPVDTLILPCNHLSLCSEDASKLQKMDTKNCPLCKRKIKSMTKVFLP